MAGTIIVSNLKTDTDNSFIVRSNTGATLFSCNTSGLDVANTIPAGSITASKLAVGAALPSQTGSGTYYLTTDGTNASWKAQTALTIANTQLTGTLTASQIASINASTATSGTLPKARLPAGSVLQVVHTVLTSVVSVSGSAWNEITSLATSITPTSSSSKILIIPGIDYATANGYRSGLKIVRDSTDILLGDSASNRIRASQLGRFFDGSDQMVCQANRIYLDSPATTSAITYKFYLSAEGATGATIYVNRTVNDADFTSHFRGTSTITLMEIAV
jgi:hypothetical protein